MESGGLLLGILLFLYFIPAIIASSRNHISTERFSRLTYFSEVIDAAANSSAAAIAARLIRAGKLPSRLVDADCNRHPLS